MSSQQSQQSQVSRTAARRRQRSTRLMVAAGLLVVAALLVIGAIASGSSVLVTVVAVVALLAGAAATRITHSELMEARREAARDRAAQAQDFRVLTERRTEENAVFASDMKRKIADREHAIDVLERALSSAQKNAAEQTLKRGQEARRADVAENGRDEADTRAAEAIVRVIELEAELDVLRAELDAMRADTARRGHRSA
jgi:ABC-type iron transport system FetAB ATPase subunit